LPFLRIKLK